MTFSPKMAQRAWLLAITLLAGSAHGDETVTCPQSSCPASPANPAVRVCTCQWAATTDPSDFMSVKWLTPHTSMGRCYFVSGSLSVSTNWSSIQFFDDRPWSGCDDNLGAALKSIGAGSAGINLQCRTMPTAGIVKSSASVGIDFGACNP